MPAMTGLSLMNNTGGPTIEFTTALNVTNTGGPGIFAMSAGGINAGAGIINTANGAGIDATGPTFAATFSVVSGGSGGVQRGINLEDIGGMLTMTAGTIPTGTTMEAFRVHGGNATVSYGGGITNGADNGVLIEDLTGGSVTLSGAIDENGAGILVQNNTGGTFTFSGTSVDIDPSGANTGVTLSSNTGATINFTNGGLAINTTTGTGFNATGGGTVNVTTDAGTGNTITSTTGTALNVNSTTIGASDLNFESISSNGAANGIVLNTTGSSGGLTVTGDGTLANNASGGTIQNTTSHAISATDTQDLSLTAIRIQNPGNSSTEHGILATSLRGSSLLRASTITGFNQSSGDGFRVVNNNVNLTELRINNSTFSASDGNDALSVFAQGSSVMTIIVENQTLFTDLEGDALEIIAGDLGGSTATVNLTVDDNDFTSAGVTGNGGIQARANQDGTLSGSITNNTFNDTHRLLSTSGVIEIQGNNTGSVNLTVSGNDLDTFGQSGINVVADDASDVTVDIDGNFIDTNVNDRIGIRGSIRNTGATRLTIQNNQVGQTTAMPGTGGTRSPIDILVFDDTGPTDDVRILIDTNQLRANKTSNTSELIDVFVDTNADLDLTVTNNTLTNVANGDAAEIILDTATLCLDLRTNTANSGEIELEELAGTYSVEDLANVVTNNPGATILFFPNMGAFSNAASCLTP